MRNVYIAGGSNTPFIGKFHPEFVWKGHPDFGKRQNPNIDGYIRTATLDALTQAGCEPVQVDRAYVGNFVGELFESQGHLGSVLVAAHPDLAGKPVARLEGACASGGLALAAGFDAVRAGADIVLVVGAEVQTTASARVGADYLARAAHYARQREIDEFTFPALFARRTKHVVESTDTTLDDCALASVKAYANANRNHRAHMNAVKMSFEKARTVSDKNPAFLGNDELKPYVRVSDCSQVSDGGSGIVLCSAEGLQRVSKTVRDSVELVTVEVGVASIAEDPNPLRLDNTAATVARAFGVARIAPTDVHVAEVHDCFTIAEILMYEALGWASQGKGASLLREGVTAIDGRIPVNPGGGLVGFGHPVGATGVKQAVEIYSQMQGLCGDYQLRRRPEVGLSVNMGGDDRTCVVSLYRACG